MSISVFKKTRSLSKSNNASAAIGLFTKLLLDIILSFFSKLQKVCVITNFLVNLLFIKSKKANEKEKPYKFQS